MNRRKILKAIAMAPAAAAMPASPLGNDYSKLIAQESQAQGITAGLSRAWKFDGADFVPTTGRIQTADGASFIDFDTGEVQIAGASDDEFDDRGTM